jgi:hypothetical protein
MAVKGSKSKKTSAKSTKGNPTRTKVKTKSIQPKTVSAYKNSLTKQVSQQSLKARAQGGTGTGVSERQGPISVSRSTNIFKPTLTATAKKGIFLRSKPTIVKKVIKRSK